MASAVPDLIPARILNEHVYCSRLAYLEWVDRQFTDNQDTAEGSFVHRRAHRERGQPPSPLRRVSGRPAARSPCPRSTSGLIAKLDLLVPRGATLVPVEYKRGSPRSAAEPLWEPELAQVCAQVLLLREAGYRVDHAEAYFAETRTRHRVEVTDALVARTLDAIEEVRANAARDGPPLPLVDSPKCPRCALVGICLPDEVNALRLDRASPTRRLVASDSPATPLYATTPGSRLSKRGRRVIQLEQGEEVVSRRLIDVSHIAVFGNVTVGSAVLRACFDSGVPILWFTAGGWLSGVATGMPPNNVQARMRQHQAAMIGAPELASSFVVEKIRNARTLLRRHAGDGAAAAIGQLLRLVRAAEDERNIESLLGLEGTAARIYFQHFGSLLRPPKALDTFRFDERNRRPPCDPVNALLSFAYAMLVKDTTVALLAAGLDPYVGVYHRPRFGRPALALDLAEEFRPLIADSVVLMAINNGEVRPGDFVSRAGAVALTQAGRRRFIETYERRMCDELKHPLFGYRASYRRTLEIQARLLVAVLVGDIPAYRSLTTR